MMLTLLFVLAQAAATQPTPAPAQRPTPAPTRTPAPTPRPTVAPTAIPRGDGTNTGLAGAASRVKLNRQMSFDDFAAKAPSAQPTEDPAAGTAEAAGEWMDLEILDLDAFLGRADPSYQRAKRIDKAWRDDESTRLLLP